MADIDVGGATGNWLPVLAFAAAISPIAIGAGVLTGIFARRWWHLTAAPGIAATIVALWSGGRVPAWFALLIMVSATWWAALARVARRRLFG